MHCGTPAQHHTFYVSHNRATGRGHQLKASGYKVFAIRPYLDVQYIVAL